MDFNEFKQQYPDWAKQIEESAEKDTQIEQKDTEINRLNQSNTDLSGRLQSLELSEAARREQDMKNHAQSIIDKELSQSNVPERLHAKVGKAFSYKQFVDQEGNFDEAKFTEHVQADVKEWSDTFADVDSSTIQGAADTGLDGGEYNQEDAETISDRMAGLVSKK